MPEMTIEQLISQYPDLPTSVRESYKEVKDLNDKVLEHFNKVKDNEELVTKSEKDEVITYNKKIQEKEMYIRSELDRLNIKQAAEGRSAYFQTVNTPNVPLPGDGNTDPEGRNHVESKKDFSAGEVAMSNKSFKDWCNMADKTSGRVGDSPVVEFPDYNVKSLITGTSATSAGAFVNYEHRPMTEQGLFFRELGILDLIPTIPISTPLIDYVEELTYTNAAAAVIEATSTSTGTKPESAMTWNLKTSQCQIVAHWFPVTRNALSDVPRMEALINNALTYGIREELEDLVINGDGVSPNLLGMLNVSGVLTQAFDTNVFTSIRKGITKVQRPGNDGTPGGNVDPDIILMHPVDWEGIELTLDNNAQFYYGGPMALGTKRMWGRTVITAFGMSAGTAIVTTRRFHELYVREGITVRASDQHENYFIKNLVAVLAEGRFGYVHRRPSATALVTLA